MRPGSALLLALLTLLAVAACSSGPSWSPTRFAAAQRHQEASRRRAHVGTRLRVKRQISEIVRLYNELSKENREDRDQAVSRIQAILEGVFAAPNVTSTTPENSASTKEGTDNSTEAASTSRPPPRLDREMLVANLRRNLRGLGRLFMRELRAALNGMLPE